MLLALRSLLALVLVTCSLAASPRRGSEGHDLSYTKNYAPLVRRDNERLTPSGTPAYTAIIRPTRKGANFAMEVQINNVPRYLFIDTGSADTWMVSPDYECLNASYATVSQRDCLFADPYTGPVVPQAGNDSLNLQYGTGEVVGGPMGPANVTIAGRMVLNQKVSIVDRAYLLGDSVRSGVLGLAPRAVTARYENKGPKTTPPNGTATPYRTVFEGMYSSPGPSNKPIAPLFSLALKRGLSGGYIAFGGLPPVDHIKNLIFTPFRGLNYYGRRDPTHYYPIQPDGFRLNGVKTATKYRAIIDSGTTINRLPTSIADKINAKFEPPAKYMPELQLYMTACNATVPAFSIDIGNQTFTMAPADMLPPYLEVQGQCVTGVTRGFAGTFSKEAYPEGFYALGSVFLHNVIAVFDVGKDGMWFAEHNY